MISISSVTFAAASMLLAGQNIFVDAVALSAMTDKGCYSSSTGLTFNSTYTYQTSGWCQPLCVEMGASVLGLTEGKDCWCGDLLPPASSLVDDSNCDDPCSGYDLEMCGGESYWSIYLSGTETNVKNAVAGASTSAVSSAGGSTSTTSATPSVVTVGGQTVIVTATGQAASVSAAAAKSSPNKAGIAAGVVVGVVGILGLAGGAFLFLRSKKRREIEEEHRRNAAVNDFIHNKPPNSSGGSSLADTRLDATVMAQRRMSDGSIADNQDYSRRILKVTNA